MAVQIIGEQNPALSPDQVLMTGLKPIQDAIATRGERGFEVAKTLGVDQPFAKSQQERQLQAEKEIAIMRDKMYLDRAEKMANARVQAMDVREKSENIRQLVANISKLRGQIPTRQKDETDDSFYTRLSTMYNQSLLDDHNSKIGAFKNYDDEIEGLQGQLDKAAGGQLDPVALRGKTTAMAMMGLPEVADKFGDKGPQFTQAVAALGNAATPEHIALVADKLGIRPYWDAYYSSMQDRATAVLMAENPNKEISGLARRLQELQQRRDMLIQSSPDAASDYFVQRGLSKQFSKTPEGTTVPGFVKEVAATAPAAAKPMVAKLTPDSVMRPFSAGGTAGGSDIDTTPAVSSKITKEDYLDIHGLYLDKNNQLQAKPGARALPDSPSPAVLRLYGRPDMADEVEADHQSFKKSIAIALRVLNDPKIPWRNQPQGVPQPQIAPPAAPSQPIIQPIPNAPVMPSVTPDSVMSLPRVMPVVLNHQPVTPGNVFMRQPQYDYGDAYGDALADISSLKMPQ